MKDLNGVTAMDLKFFPNFVRAVNPAAGQFSNEDLRELGAEFQTYLDGLDLSPAVRADMMAIEPHVIVPRIGRIGYFRGYHPTLAWNFTTWVDALMSEAGVSVTKA